MVVIHRTHKQKSNNGCTQWQSIVEPRYDKVLGTMKITLLYQVSHYIRVKKQRNLKSWDQQNYLVIRGFCYIRPLYNEVPLYAFSHGQNFNSWIWLHPCLFSFDSKDMEAEVNIHYNELIGKTTLNYLLTNQLQRVLMCLDVFLETQRGRPRDQTSIEGPNEFVREKMYTRVTRYVRHIYQSNLAFVSGSLDSTQEPPPFLYSRWEKKTSLILCEVCH